MGWEWVERVVLVVLVASNFILIFQNRRQGKTIRILSEGVARATLPPQVRKMATVLIDLHDKHVNLSQYTHESIHRLLDALNQMAVAVELCKVRLEAILAILSSGSRVHDALPPDGGGGGKNGGEG